MKKQTLNGLNFTSREMDAITNMLLGSNGVNVDPIIDDLYADLEESQKSMFRCKIALMMKGTLPKFQERVGFHRDCLSRVLKVKIFGESSLLGLTRIEVLEAYKKHEGKDGSEDWVLNENDYSIGTRIQENIDYCVYDTLEEAVKNW